jgi:Integrase core domain
VASSGEAVYVMTVIDDFSRYIWVALIKTKDEASHQFKVYQAWAERLHERRIKQVRFDGGGEYGSIAFKTYLESSGVTTPDTTYAMYTRPKNEQETITEEGKSDERER